MIKVEPLNIASAVLYLSLKEVEDTDLSFFETVENIPNFSSPHTTHFAFTTPTTDEIVTLFRNLALKKRLVLIRVTSSVTGWPYKKSNDFVETMVNDPGQIDN